MSTSLSLYGAGQGECLTESFSYWHPGGTLDKHASDAVSVQVELLSCLIGYRTLLVADEAIVTPELPWGCLHPGGLR